MGEKKSLNTLQKQTLQSSMAYLDALTMKLLEIQPTRLLLNVTAGYVDSAPPWPSPQSHSPPSRFTSLRMVLLCFARSERRVKSSPLPFLFVH